MRVGVPVETDRKTCTSTCAFPSPSRPGPVGYDGADCHAPASPSDDTFLAPLDPKSTEFVLVKACATCADEGEGLRDREITIMFPPAIFHMLFAGRTGNGKCCLVIPCFVFGQQQCTEKKIIHRVPRIYEHFPSHRTHADGVILSDVRGRQPPPPSPQAALCSGFYPNVVSITLRGTRWMCMDDSRVDVQLRPGGRPDHPH